MLVEIPIWKLMLKQINNIFLYSWLRLLMLTETCKSEICFLQLNFSMFIHMWNHFYIFYTKFPELIFLSSQFLRSCHCFRDNTYRSRMTHFFLVGWDWVHLVLRPQFGLLYQPRMIDDECGAVGRMLIIKGNRSTREKSCPSPSLFTTNSTGPDPGSNLGPRGGKQPNNRPSYGTPYVWLII
jgi:hypothetical protein